MCRHRPYRGPRDRPPATPPRESRWLPGGTDQRPGRARIARCERPLPSVPAKSIRGSEGACAKARIDWPRRPSHRVQLRPPSWLTHNPPSGLIHCSTPLHRIVAGFVRVHDNMIQNQVVGRVQLRQPLPGTRLHPATRRANYWWCPDTDDWAGQEPRRRRARRRPRGLPRSMLPAPEAKAQRRDSGE